MNPLYIEFTGPPGVGKSTISNALLAEFIQHNDKRFLSPNDAFLEVSRNHCDSIFSLILRLLPRPMAHQLMLKLFNRTHMQHHAMIRFLARYNHALPAFTQSSVFMAMHADEKAKALEFFIEAISVHTCCQELGDSTRWVVYDEGLIQKSYMFLTRSGIYSAEDAKIYLAQIPKASIVICVAAPADMCKKRIQERSRGLTQKLIGASTKEFDAYFENAIEHQSNINKILADDKNVSVIQVSSEDSIASVSDMLYKKCIEIVNSKAPIE